MKVSVVMAVRGRPVTTRRALQSYTRISYPDWEIIFTDVTAQETLVDVAKEFTGRLPIKYVPFQIDKKIRTPARTWNYGFEQAAGDILIFTGGDILISEPDMLERFEAQLNDHNRVNVLTYHLTQQMTDNLDNLPWLSNHKVIQGQRGFWDTMIMGETNSMKTSAGLTTFIMGMKRSTFEQFGKFREDDSHLTADHDVLMRFRALGWQSDTLNDYICYHQWHPVIKIEGTPGWTYENEAQARLLEPAIRDEV